MRDKNGCLGCHFLSLLSMERDGTELNPLPIGYRNRDGFSKLLQRLDSRIYSVKCSREMWDSNKIENKMEIEKTLFKKARGKKCPLFSLYDNEASLKAIIECNRRQEDVSERNFTRRLAVIAIVVSALATLIATLLPLILPKYFSF